jgi:dihydrofolate synthase/folylpolyglutamate synthase
MAFRELAVDWGVIEVGLGGRLDASNVISRPAATAIVTIDYDHQTILGNTLAAIAAEKSGIIKQGSPLISGLLPPEAERVVNAAATGTKHYRYKTDYGVALVEGGASNVFGYWGKDFPIAPMTSFDFTSPLPGIHQGHNLSVAATIGLAIGMKPEIVKAGIESVYWPARLESLSVDGCSILMDCAHNEAGIRAFIDYLCRTNAGLVDLTFGVLDTKNWKGMIAMLAPHVRHWRLIRPDSERALQVEQVKDEVLISSNEVRISSYGSDYEALARDMVGTSDGEVRYVTGSMYMIGKLRTILGVPVKPIWKVGDRTPV